MSVLAAASTQADTPAWLVPTIAGGAALLGTFIGGFLTFLSARAADKRKEKAEAKRQREAQIKDVSVRFLKAITKLLIKSHDLKQQAEEHTKDFEDSIERINRIGDKKTSQSPQEQAGAEESPTSESNERVRELTAAVAKAKEKALAIAIAGRDVSRGYGSLDDELASEVDGLLAEMSLILPTETAHKAEKMVTEVMKRYVAAYLPPEKKPDRELWRSALNSFINDVRKLLGQKKPYSPLNDVHEVTDFLKEAVGSFDDKSAV
jgi:uncharacterized phage infection (PIP) family protein YhgE